jgi:hypothetical protein
MSTWIKNKINKRVTAEAKLTPDDWDLYTSMPEIERVAENLNKRFNECVNGNMSRDETRRKMEQEMFLFKAWGASDTEPFYVLEKLLDEVYK